MEHNFDDFDGATPADLADLDDEELRGLDEPELDEDGEPKELDFDNDGSDDSDDSDDVVRELRDPQPHQKRELVQPDGSPPLQPGHHLTSRQRRKQRRQGRLG